MKRTLPVIFASFISSAIIYFLIGYFLHQKGITPVISDVSSQRLLFIIFSVVAFSDLVTLQILKSKLIQRNPDGSEFSDQPLLPRYIVLFAIAEMPAILALVSIFLTGNLLHLIVLTAASMLGFFLARP